MMNHNRVENAFDESALQVSGGRSHLVDKQGERLTGHGLAVHQWA